VELSKFDQLKQQQNLGNVFASFTEVPTLACHLGMAYNRFFLSLKGRDKLSTYLPFQGRQPRLWWRKQLPLHFYPQKMQYRHFNCSPIGYPHGATGFYARPSLGYILSNTTIGHMRPLLQGTRTLQGQHNAHFNTLPSTIYNFIAIIARSQLDMRWKCLHIRRYQIKGGCINSAFP